MSNDKIVKMKAVNMKDVLTWMMNNAIFLVLLVLVLIVVVVEPTFISINNFRNILIALLRGENREQNEVNTYLGYEKIAICTVSVLEM